MLKFSATRLGIQLPKTCYLHGEAVAIYNGDKCPVCRTHEWLNEQVEAGLNNAEMIRAHAEAIANQRRMIDDRDGIIAAGETERRRLSNLLLSATNRHAAHVIEVANLQEEIEEQADTIRERDGTIEKYREDFRVMTGKIDGLTPECEHCDGGEAVCGCCGGSGAANPQDDPRDQIVCPNCNGSGEAKCSECGKGTES